MCHALLCKIRGHLKGPNNITGGTPLLFNDKWKFVFVLTATYHCLFTYFKLPYFKISWYLPSPTSTSIKSFPFYLKKTEHSAVYMFALLYAPMVHCIVIVRYA